MKSNIRFIPKVASILLALVLIASVIPLNSYATSIDNSEMVDTVDPVVVVSLGDSYSSGEGIEPFFGQDKSLSERVKDDNWLAHRSQKSWSSLIEIEGVSGTLGNYNVSNGNASEECQWYFAAVSGAETKHINDQTQRKDYKKKNGSGLFADYITGYKDLPKQLDVIRNNNLNGVVDYVTLSIGGNDVGFADIVTTCAVNCSYLHFGSTSKLEDTLDSLWANFDNTKADIKKAYEDIQVAAGEQAEIIVAGYPKLLDKNGKGAVINKDEATLVNNNVSKFNDEIEAIVNECRASGMNIHFVDVEAEFDKDGGHQAYSDNSWINGVMIGAKSQDIDDKAIASSYSIHPNELGAQAYARCVNAKIKEIEAAKSIGVLSGKICKASDRITAIPGATITARNANNFVYVTSSNATGNYSLELPAGKYLVSIKAEGYIDFNSYATVIRNENTYMETFLLVEGSDAESGIASGKVVNSLTGAGTPGITLMIKKDWNSADEESEIVTTTITDENGNYSVELPLGNYTVIATKEGYTSSSFNIIVQEGTTNNQNGTITPLITGDNYLITLTWGENPRDLDSHVEGTLSSGSKFHVYYSHKSQYDGDIEVCNLDYDDTTSYGPEHITLNTTNDTPYYYYIYRFAGSGTVGNSRAKITIEQGNTLIAEFNVPTDLGDEDYWNVFAIKNGELIINNTITSSPNLEYAN